MITDEDLKLLKASARVDYDAEDEYLRSLLETAEASVVRRTNRDITELTDGETSRLKAPELRQAVCFLAKEWYENGGVTVDGREYPCYPTMGACVRFHDMTGKEVAEVKGWQTSMQCIYLYCCIKSACEREKKEFPYECAEFCDNVPLGDLHAWLEAESERLTEEEAEKKSPSA